MSAFRYRHTSQRPWCIGLLIKDGGKIDAGRSRELVRAVVDGVCSKLRQGRESNQSFTRGTSKKDGAAEGPR